MANSFNMRAISESLKEVKDKNPFEDGTDFESFFCIQYDSKISEQVLNTNLEIPLNVYKFLLLKCYHLIRHADDMFNCPIISEILLRRVEEYQEVYGNFVRKEIKMTPQESSYLKVAHALLELAEVVLKIVNRKFLPNALSTLKTICSEILGCYNAAAEVIFQYLKNLLTYMSDDNSFEICRFILCLMTEIMKKTKEFRTAKGLLTRNPGMIKHMIDIEMDIQILKLRHLNKMFTISNFQHVNGPSGNSMNDEENGKMLMQLFELGLDLSKNDDGLFKIATRIKTFEEAKEVYELILKLAQVRKSYKDPQYSYDGEFFEGLAHSNFAAYHTDKPKIYRLSEMSFNQLTALQDKKNDNPANKYDFILAAVDENFRRMWSIDLEIYKDSRTVGDYVKLRTTSKNRTLWAEKMMTHPDLNLPFEDWWVYLDVFKCYLQVFKDDKRAKEFADKIYASLHDKVSRITYFEEVTGLKFDRNMSGADFLQVLRDKFDNSYTDIESSYTDSPDFESFVCYYYDDLTEEFLAATCLQSPLNIYKYMTVMLQKLTDPIGNGRRLKSFPTKLREKMKEVKEKYKDFISQKIAMNPEEQEYLKSALAALELAEIALEPEEINPVEFDFTKFKNICSSLLDGFAGESPIIFLRMVFFEMMVNQYFNVCCFILILMKQLCDKAEKIRSDNRTKSKHPCVQEALNVCGSRVAYDRLHFLDYVLTVSSNSVAMKSTSQIIPNDTLNGEILMEIFENSDIKDELSEIKVRPGNYEEAKVIYDMILKLTDQRKSDGYTQRTYDARFFECLAPSRLAAFITDPAIVYKVCEESIRLSFNWLSHDYDLNQNPENKVDYMMEAVDENLRRMWNIKYNIYKNNKTDSNLKALKEIAASRIERGNFFINFNGEISFERWWVYLDLIKCYVQVFQDFTNARTCAGSIYDELMRDQTGIPKFVNSTGIDFDLSSIKQNFVKSLLQKYKTA